MSGTRRLARLDPRSKLLAAVATAGLTLAAHGILGLAAVGLFTLLGLAAAGVGPRGVWRGLRPLLPLMVLTVAASVVTGPVGTDAARISGVAGAVRLALWGAQSVALTASTDPVALCQAAAWFLAPLALVGVDPEEVGWMATLAVGFLPLLSEEADRILLAQRGRGAGGGGMRARAAAVGAFLMALFVAGVRQADAVAQMLESRGFDLRPRGHRSAPLRPGTAELVAGAALVLLWGCVFWRPGG